MPSLSHLVVRDDSHHQQQQSQPGLSPTTAGILIALVSLFAAIGLLGGILLVLRQMRRKQAERDQELPEYSEKPLQHTPTSRGSKLFGITTSCTRATAAAHEKEGLMDRYNTPRGDAHVPEIRITFPEEVDASGNRTSGKVVVVNIGEHSVGLEPVHDEEDLPPYQRKDDGGFQDLDLERMGGLKEKEMR